MLVFLFKYCLLHNRLHLDCTNQWIRRRKWSDLKLHLSRAPPPLPFPLFWPVLIREFRDAGGSSPPGQILIWASELSTPCSFLLATSFLGGGARIPPESCSTYGGQGAQLRAKACWDSTPFISQLQGWAWTNWLSCVCWIYMHVCHSYSLEAWCISRAWADGMWGRERTSLTLRRARIKSSPVKPVIALALRNTGQLNCRAASRGR